MRASLVRIALGAALVVLLSVQADAQTDARNDDMIVIRQVQWGFDGKVPERAFAPFSVLVDNTGPAAVSGTLRLERDVGRNRRQVHYEQSFYVSGFSSRWVQVTPRVTSDYENWNLYWGPEFRHRQELPTPVFGERATVLFADPDDPTARGSALRRCDPALFPVSVTATDALRGAVLHHAPHWEGARAQAFREWLARGGRVYLLRRTDGTYPRFPQELAFLNDPRERFEYGAGVVHRLPFTVDEIDFDTASRLILQDDNPPDEITAETAAGVMSPVSRASSFIPFDELVFGELQLVTRFHRNWWLVYGTAVLYLLAVFPGCYLLGRRVADWRWFYAGFLGTCVLFSVGFSKLGELGSSETNRVRSVATARQLEDGLYDVTQWSMLAVIDGGRYSLTSPGSGRLYSSGEALEPMGGIVRLQDGLFEVEVPTASTASVLHRARAKGPVLNVRLVNVLVDELGLDELSVQFAPEVYDRSMLVCAWHGGQIYELKADRSGARLSGRRASAETFINTIGVLPWAEWNQGFPVDEDDPSAKETFHTLLHQLVGSTVGLSRGARADQLSLNPEIVRLLIYRPAPPEFAFLGDEFPDQQGFVLYVVDLPLAGDSQ